MQNVLFAFFAGLFGLIIGSFLNVLIFRKPIGGRPTGRSYCRNCQRILSPRELIPLASFVIQKGRCRHCGIVLSIQYPLVELLTALAFAVASWMIIQDAPLLLNYLNLFLAFLGISASIYILVVDYKHYLIPDGAVLLLALVGLATSFGRTVETHSYQVLRSDLAGAFIFTLILGALWFFPKGTWMGFGDVKLIFATSLLIGFPLSLSAFLFSFWSGALIGIPLLILKKRKPQDHIPFGPSILIGALAAYFWGYQFLELAGIFYLLH